MKSPPWPKMEAIYSEQILTDLEYLQQIRYNGYLSLKTVRILKIHQKIAPADYVNGYLSLNFLPNYLNFSLLDPNMPIQHWIGKIGGVWREKPTAPSRRFPRRFRPFTRRVAGVVLASGRPPPHREAAPPPRDAGAAPAGNLEAQESATTRAPCRHGCWAPRPCATAAPRIQSPAPPFPAWIRSSSSESGVGEGGGGGRAGEGKRRRRGTPERRRRRRGRGGGEGGGRHVKGGRRGDFFMCRGCFAKRSSVKYEIFYSFSVSGTFYENPLQHKSILRKLYRYPLYQICWKGA